MFIKESLPEPEENNVRDNNYHVRCLITRVVNEIGSQTGQWFNVDRVDSPYASFCAEIRFGRSSIQVTSSNEQDFLSKLDETLRRFLER